MRSIRNGVIDTRPLLTALTSVSAFAGPGGYPSCSHQYGTPRGSAPSRTVKRSTGYAPTLVTTICVPGCAGTDGKLTLSRPAKPLSTVLRRTSGSMASTQPKSSGPPGFLGLLIAGPRGIPLEEFAADTLGGLLAQDAKNGTRLLETLRAYLDQNCNQRDTAAVLFVHQKTVKYRLDVIERLTGLQMTAHRDRMRADIAVRAIDLDG